MKSLDFTLNLYLKNFINFTTLELKIMKKFLIPITINERLEKLTRLDKETMGILLYNPDKYELKHEAFEYVITPVSIERTFKPESIEYKIEGIYLTGIGDSNSVEELSEPAEVINFFHKNDKLGYIYIEFHVHTQKTVEEALKKGNDVSNGFSYADHTLIEGRLQLKPWYIGTVITPKIKKFLGKGEICYDIVNDLENIDLSQKIKDIEKLLGCSGKCRELQKLLL